MKIYFAGSIRGGRGDKELYLQLIRYISKYLGKSRFVTCSFHFFCATIFLVEII
jgi:hypothetical protein